MLLRISLSSPKQWQSKIIRAWCLDRSHIFATNNYRLQIFGSSVKALEKKNQSLREMVENFKEKPKKSS
jgi:hypothetical protein